MSHGTVTGEVAKEEFSEKTIMNLAMHAERAI
jgi:hypothetical protein